MVTDASVLRLMQVSRRAQGLNGCTGADEPRRGSLSDRTLIAKNRCTVFSFHRGTGLREPSDRTVAMG